MKKNILLSLISLMISCSDSAPESNTTLKFNRSDYGKDWPFSVNEIEVYCAGYKEIYCIADNGKIYPLNGSAKDGSGSKPGISDIREIWLDDPELAGTKISYSQFIGPGLTLCEDK